MIASLIFKGEEKALSENKNSPSTQGESLNDF